MAVSTKPQVTKLPWWTALLTVTCITLAFVFHRRWIRPVSQWPLNLPSRPYAFVNHPDLQEFGDAATSSRWAGMVRAEWWDSEWRDDTGRRFPRGIDMFHKMHCLIAIREEFVALATDETRAALDARDPDAKDQQVRLELNRNHLQHCFDFLRQDLLCAADMTLEPLGEGYVETDGQGVEHECLDWRILLDHMGIADVDEM